MKIILLILITLSLDSVWIIVRRKLLLVTIGTERVNFAYICTCIGLKETFLWATITWSAIGKQNIQAKNGC